MRRWLVILPLGIRVQLTLWYTIISSVLVLLFGIAFYTSLQASFASNLDVTLQMRSQQVAEGISSINGKITVENIVGELPELDATAALMDTSDDRGGTEAKSDQAQSATPVRTNSSIFVRVLDRTGKTIYISSTFPALSVPRQSVTQPLRNGIPWRGTIGSVNGQSVRLYSTVLMDGTTLVGVVQVGQSLAGVNTQLQHIILGLLLVIPFILVLSSFVSYWLAGRAFRPIHRLAHTAREIGANDLHQRVLVPTARDEVQEFALIFNQMIERLEKAFMQQRRFVADASHELRTPVTAVRSMTEVALSQPGSSEDYMGVLREVNAEAERLSRLINDLLALARADERQVQFDVDSVRLDLLATDTVESLEPLALERDITLSFQTAEPATVRGDAARLIQVIIGLVDNALTYTNAGGRVTVSVEIHDATAYLIVSDTGIGIAQEDIGHIFERFYRADPARSRAAGGCGLGLALVEWIVHAHGGKVTVESQMGRGSTFTVVLPLEAATEIPSADAQIWTS
ncbi:MAG TPA: ATP-binding protein [Ktedonobacteraceae bacterium]|nr:ATP-binding protein [Ktedonobacteraceae bacterium]